MNRLLRERDIASQEEKYIQELIVSRTLYTELYWVVSTSQKILPTQPIQRERKLSTRPPPPLPTSFHYTNITRSSSTIPPPATVERIYHNLSPSCSYYTYKFPTYVNPFDL